MRFNRSRSAVTAARLALHSLSVKSFTVVARIDGAVDAHLYGCSRWTDRAQLVSLGPPNEVGLTGTESSVPFDLVYFGCGSGLG
jgi:hypothetical protein